MQMLECNLLICCYQRQMSALRCDVNWQEWSQKQHCHSHAVRDLTLCCFHKNLHYVLLVVCYLRHFWINKPLLFNILLATI